jgi:release factor glutamine methyltransferase
LRVARDNADPLGLASRAYFVACDYGVALREGFDLVVSNPPYIASGEIAGLAAEVRDYDPLLALDGGISGLDGYRAVVADAGRLLSPTGILVMELGAGQATAVETIMREGGIEAECSKPDLSGIFRAILGRPAMRG